MDILEDGAMILCFSSLILLLLLDSHRALGLLQQVETEEVHSDNMPSLWELPLLDRADDGHVNEAVLHHFQLWSSMLSFDEELGFWVKPRSTTWFSKFLLEEYDDDRWVHMFRMTKRSILSLAELLGPLIRKRDTNYRQCIPATVRLACALFKLSHGASLLICSELFAVGRSTVSNMLRDVVVAVNVGLRNEIMWPGVEDVPGIAARFQAICGLPGVAGAIDGTHFAIRKPRIAPADYFYFKSGGYSMTCQAVVDSEKRFLHLNVGMPGSTNDSRVLRRSALYHRGLRRTLWDRSLSFQSFAPYLIGDAGFPLMPWLLVPHRRQGPLSVAATLFNRKLSKGRAVVENAFALLKQSFRELQMKSDLDVKFLPDVVVCCGILHNILIKQTHEQVEQLLRILHLEALGSQNAIQEDREEQQPDIGNEDVDDDHSQQKRVDLGLFLALQRTGLM